jgi:DNA-directed RNA polymerase subunit RPC12/RpoP
MDDILQQQWACLTCSSTFPVGEVRFNASEPVGTPWPCPRCGTRSITPADGQTRETAEYFGDIGTLQ